MERFGVPDPYDSHEAALRFLHQDLDGLSPRRLRVELWRTEAALLAIPERNRSDVAERAWDWWWARHEAVRHALQVSPAR